MTAEFSTTETELIARARAGDRASFCALAARYERRVHTLALHFCRDPADAEDLSQEVWLRAFRSLASFRAESSFYTWLRRIAVNAFLNDRRAAKARREDDHAATPADGDAGEVAAAAVTFDAEATLHDRLLAEKVLGALGELPAQQRLVFLLKHREGMTYEEIALALGCSPGTVKKALSRAVHRLRARLTAGGVATTSAATDDSANDSLGLRTCSAREGF